MPVDPKVQRIGEAWYAVWESKKLVFEFSRLTEHKDTLSAELSVTSGVEGALHWSRINLASATGRTGVIKALDEVLPGQNWRLYLDRSCQLVARGLRTVEPAVSLEPAPPQPGSWLVEPWIPKGEITVLYGDGGTGKSLLALAFAVSGLSGYSLGGPWRVGAVKKVLYLDWETDAKTHGERLWGLTDHLEKMSPGAIVYRPLFRALTDEIGTIRADVDRHQPDLIITDSLGPACGAEPESADAAVRTLMALRSLPATKVVIAHVSKASAEQATSRPFGSVYVQNLARSTIEARRQDDGDDDNEVTLSLYHRKANNSRKAKPSALTFAFDEGRIGVRAGEPDLQSAGLPAQILDALRHGSKTVTLLAEETGSTPASVRVTLGRLEKRNKVLRLDTLSLGRGKKAVWGRVDEKRNDE